jgi:hypothetical protein
MIEHSINFRPLKMKNLIPLEYTFKKWDAQAYAADKHLYLPLISFFCIYLIIPHITSVLSSSYNLLIH